MQLLDWGYASYKPTATHPKPALHRSWSWREQISQVDVLILDELGEAMRRGFVTREDVEALIAMKPTTTELVLTGRGLLPLADLADLVTEMRPVKHYFDEGLLARQGIEY